MQDSIIRLTDRPDMKTQMAEWFHEKWKLPLSAYEASMDECLRSEKPYPEWYVYMDGSRIVGGLGVIENDFHSRRDLYPNVCAVYVEEDHRGKGIAGLLLNFVCRDMAGRGIGALYLVTDHIGFYERYGWRFFCSTRNDGDLSESRVYRKDSLSRE